MSIEPSPRSKTIDDLGVDISNRYAKDQQLYDKSLIQEARRISSQTSIEPLAQAFGSEMEGLFQTSQRNQSWALFESPKNYYINSPYIFSFQILPSLGNEENFILLKQRVREKVEKEKKKKGKTRQSLFEDEIEIKENEEESQKIIAFLDILEQLDRLIIEANSKRSQYQRG